MNWEAIAAVGEVLGAVAVIVSLAYLAVQIKANTTSIEVASRQSVSNEFREFNRFLVEDPEIFPSRLLIFSRKFTGLDTIRNTINQ